MFNDDVTAQQEMVTTSIGANALPFRLEDYVGGTFAGKPIAGQQQVISQLDTGFTQSSKNGTITFGFLDGPTAVGLYNGPKYHALFVTEGFGYQEFYAA